MSAEVASDLNRCERRKQWQQQKSLMRPERSSQLAEGKKDNRRGLAEGRLELKAARIGTSGEEVRDCRKLVLPPESRRPELQPADVAYMAELQERATVVFGCSYFSAVRSLNDIVQERKLGGPARLCLGYLSSYQKFTALRRWKPHSCQSLQFV